MSAQLSLPGTDGEKARGIKSRPGSNSGAKSHSKPKPSHRSPVGKPALRSRVAHRARPVHKGRHPVHVTLRVKHGLPSLRQQVIHGLIKLIVREQRVREYGSDFQIGQFTIQSNHVHFVVEAADGPTQDPKSRKKNPLWSGVSGFKISFARRLNKLLGRKGSVWADRYHREDLETPRQVRHALRYVLLNYRKHGFRTFGDGAYDVYSSSFTFDGWREPPPPDLAFDPDPFVAARPRTWLLSKGWRLHGLLDLRDTPGSEKQARAA